LWIGFYGAGKNRQSLAAYVPGAEGLPSDIDLLKAAIGDLSAQLQAATTTAQRDGINCKISDAILPSEVMKVLDRLQINGQPKWGLDAQTCELVRVGLAHVAPSVAKSE
jgi:hypothetical protein